MANYKNAFPTSLGDYCAVKGIEPSKLEIQAIHASGTTHGISSFRAYNNAVDEFNRIAESYDDVVDLREGLVSQKQTGITNLVLGLHDTAYSIRGTGIKQKSE